MLHSKVDAFFDIPVLDLLVYDDADCALRNVVDNSSLAMVDLMRHTVTVQCIFLFWKLATLCDHAGGKLYGVAWLTKLTPSEQHHLP